MWLMKPLDGAYAGTILENTKNGALLIVGNNLWQSAKLNAYSEREKMRGTPEGFDNYYESQGTYELAREMLVWLNKTDKGPGAGS